MAAVLALDVGGARRAARDTAAGSSRKATSRRCSSQSAVLLVVAVGMTFVDPDPRHRSLRRRGRRAHRRRRRRSCHVKSACPPPSRSLAALAAGAAIGAWHGLWVGWLGVPAFVVTLAGFKAYRGAALVLSHATGHHDGRRLRRLDRASAPPRHVGARRSACSRSASRIVAARSDAPQAARPRAARPTRDRRARLAGQLLLAALRSLFVYGTPASRCSCSSPARSRSSACSSLRRTRFGRHLYAIGGNPEAARLSGIDVKRATLVRLHDRSACSPRIAGMLARRAHQRRHARATRATCSSSTPSPRSSSAAPRSPAAAARSSAPCSARSCSRRSRTA